MLIHNNKTTCYANSFVIISISCKYMLCKMHIIVITHSSYAINYINVLNDLCLCIKRPYTFPHFNMPHHITDIYIHINICIYRYYTSIYMYAYLYKMYIYIYIYLLYTVNAYIYTHTHTHIYIYI